MPRAFAPTSAPSPCRLTASALTSVSGRLVPRLRSTRTAWASWATLFERSSSPSILEAPAPRLGA
eukprot:4192000-Pleurochrysis_carterae.AAC.1